jgi:hypothetical protein
MIYTDGIVFPTIGAKVRHRSCDSKIGVVTATCTRSYGTNYGVVWDDLTERWHAAEELELIVEENKQIGVPL